MKLSTVSAAILLVLASAISGQSKDTSGSVLDSGSFGIFVNGKRVATESFSVQQQSSGVSIASSQLKEDGTGGAGQTAELQIMSNGTIVKYEWRELSPGKTQLTVLPNNEFLIEKIIQNPGEKAAEQPFLMPNTSVVLDNNFFLHRELLAWRYFASSCQTNLGKCTPAEFGAIVPQERVSVRVAVQAVGEEKLNIRGNQRTLVRLNVKSDQDEWALWVDATDHYKLMRVIKAGDATEVLRD
ncbi:MAG: hypothetical protein DMG91_02085 [Acidobacteria bacterium]|nr:MAG: hypothetical protein DMG91_02085 [Acidobacteriota bacterium]